MNNQKPFLAAFLIFIALIAGCDSSEIGDSKDVNQDKIYMDYNVSYTQADENVLLNFKYRFAGPAGTTLVLNDASKTEFDGEKLKVDSSDFGGAFYEVQKRFSSFIGKHSIAFTDINNKKYENSFDFTVFTLTNLPESVPADKDLIISFNGPALGADDYVDISSVDSDSSFSFRHTGPGNSITIPAAELQKQTKNSISIECSFYRQIRLTQTTSEGGILKLYYRLKPVQIKLGKGTIS